VKFRYKLMFFVACTPLWLVLAALLLEVGERARVALYAADAAYLTPYLNAAYHLPPETLPPVDLPELIAGQAASPPMVPLQPLSRKERLEHLERRHETAVLLTDSGQIVEAYIPSTAPDSKQFRSRLRSGDDFLQWVREDLRERTLSELRRAIAGEEILKQVYWFEPEDMRSVAYTFAFEAWPAGAEPGVGAALRLVPTRWKSYMTSYRANAYDVSEDDQILWTNSLGLRNREVTLPKPPGVYRIVCVGGSTTVEGPRNDMTYPYLLERKLRERLGTDRIEVVNAGVSGQNSATETGRLEEYFALEPDLIIHYNFVNDLSAIAQATRKNYDFSTDRAVGLWTLAGVSEFAYRRLDAWLLPQPETIEAVLNEVTFSHRTTLVEEAGRRGVAIKLCSFAYPDFKNMPPGYYEFQINYHRKISYGDFPLNPKLYARYCDQYALMCAILASRYGHVEYVPLQEELGGNHRQFRDTCHMFVTGINGKALYLAEKLEPELRAWLDANPA
jgi:hypothetical protein